MKTNVGIIDRIVRIVAGLVIIGLYFANVVAGTLAIVLLILAGVLILTGLVRFCPLYWSFGISSSKKSN